MNLIERISQWLLGQTTASDSSTNITNTPPPMASKSTTDSPLVQADQVVDLREVIAHAAATFHSVKFYNTTRLDIAGVTLYLLPTAQPYEREACQALQYDEVFLRLLRQALSEQLQHPTASFALQVVACSSTDEFTQKGFNTKAIYPWLHIEVLRPKTVAIPITHHLHLTATQGALWSDDGQSITITPADCPCFIGRCREVATQTGVPLSNKVAFVGPEEQPERAEILEPCRYVSRSAVRIDYNVATGQYTIMRSPYITSPNHVVHLRRQDSTLSKLTLSPYSPNQRYTLCEGDTIEFNRKIALIVHLVPIAAMD
ncbi:MAG: hypothetical protein Q4A44_05745 [Bacteroidales bacterium]|nr:hypothetical protein [Bacteroidales bacterium]